MRRAHAAAALLALVALLAACTYTSATKRYEPPGIAANGIPPTGQRWFLRDCAWCHGNNGTGTTRGPSLVTDDNGAALTDFMLSTGRMPLTDTSEVAVRRAPAYPPTVIAAISSYVASLGGPGPAIPTPDLAIASVSDGEQLFQDNCAACHSATAIGGTLTSGLTVNQGATREGNAIPGLQLSTATQLAEAIRTGPGTMPVFNRATLTDAQVDSIISYVRALQRGENRGGASLGRIGPVAEGAVAWIVGLGILVLLARWIGVRTPREEESK